MKAAVAFAVVSGCNAADSRASDTASVVSDSSSVLPATSDAAGLLVTAMSMGPIRLGMTLDSARKAAPAAKFERTSDGDGVALVEITIAPGTSVIAYAEEEDAAAAIDWTKPISMMETFSANLHTAEGVHAGSPVADVEKVYGPLKSVEKSEIESREYITFDRQPAGFTFRLDYTGIFPDGSSSTTRVEPQAKIYSIAISSPAS
jgi:hypothetical protein